MKIKVFDKIFIILYGHVSFFNWIFKGFWYSDLAFIVMIDVAILLSLNVLTIAKALGVENIDKQLLGISVFLICFLITWLYYRDRSKKILEQHKSNNEPMPSISKWLFLLYVVISIALFVYFD